MNVTIEVVCYKYKVLKNNEYPLMLRLTKGGKRKYLSIGMSTKLEHWDFNKNQPKPRTPNRDVILKLISSKVKEYRDAVLELKSDNKKFTLDSLIEYVDKPVEATTVDSFFTNHIKTLEKQSRRGYAASVLQVYNSLVKYNKHLNIFFADIDVLWLKNYEIWLRNEELKDNTIGIRFRTLRAVYNQAIEANLVKAECYPFKKFKVSKLREETVKRSISKESLLQIVNYNTDKKDAYVKLAVDLFVFSYLMGGVNFVDIANLTKENIVENTLVYRRKKTGKLIKLPIHEMAKRIVNKYGVKGFYIFPILSETHITEQQKANRIHKAITKINARLKSVGEDLGLPITLTTYVARHSFATTLKRSGTATSIISEMLGHSSERVTQIYLDSFENSQIDEAMKNLL